jgi:hypothetical protein
VLSRAFTSFSYNFAKPTGTNDLKLRFEVFNDSASLASGFNGTDEVIALDNIVVTTVPEPTSAALLGLGALGLLMRRRSC